MPVILISGPAGSGKNTVAQILAKKRERCAVVDVDTVRHMIIQPHHAPWSGEEGEEQLKLGIKNACILTKNFLADNFDVIILDVVTNWSLLLYRELLQEEKFKIAMLLPSLEEVKKRNQSREYKLGEQRVIELYQEQEKFTGYDEKIDNTSLSPEDNAEKLIKYF